MDDIIELKNKKDSYKECLKNVINTANALASTISILKSTISIQSECYSVDDQNGGSNYLNYLLEKEESLYSEIVNNVIASLNSIICNLNIEISYKEQALAMGGN